MKSTSIILIAVVVAAVVAVVALKPARSGTPAGTGGTTATPTTPTSVSTAPTPAAMKVSAALPRLLDLGADKCIPCKAMAPILEDLKVVYADTMQVDFIDVWQEKEAAQAYGISTIPTQIFFAPDGKELYRHEGFFSKDDILAQWKTLGFELKPAAATTPASTPAGATEPAITNGTTCPTSVPDPAPADAAKP